MIRRYNNWEERLHDFLLTSLHGRLVGTDDPLIFDWDLNLGYNYHNCSSWTGLAIEAMTGVNPHMELGGHLQYGTASGCYKVLYREFGMGTLEGVYALFFQEVPVVMAQTGDLGMIKVEDESAEVGEDLAIGIISTPYIYVFGPGGVQREPITGMVKVFTTDSYSSIREKEGFN